MMQREVGERSFPIWLLGDSNPPQWQDVLDTPLDPRHPVRHNIWTSVLDVIQEEVYLPHRDRVNTTRIYIRNAVEDPAIKPLGASREWRGKVTQELGEFAALLSEYRPTMLICFGAFAFEFARRALRCSPEHDFVYWGAEQLGREFVQRIESFSPTRINPLPLLHRSIAGGRYIQSHEYFCGFAKANYFEFVGRHIAKKLLDHRERLEIWA